MPSAVSSITHHCVLVLKDSLATHLLIVDPFQLSVRLQSLVMKGRFQIDSIIFLISFKQSIVNFKEGLISLLKYGYNFSWAKCSTTTTALWIPSLWPQCPLSCTPRHGFGGLYLSAWLPRRPIRLVSTRVRNQYGLPESSNLRQQSLCRSLRWRLWCGCPLSCRQSHAHLWLSRTIFRRSLFPLPTNSGNQ